MNQIKEIRREKDAFFANHPQSPLTHEQKHFFQGLKYFPVNNALRLETSVDQLKTRETIKIPMTGGDPQTYTRYGRFRFKVDGQDAELTLYSGDTGFFLPFVDSLAGKETYPGGRYVEVEQMSNSKFLVDFNLAYNPYCAYNDQWNCPLTPFENRLKVPIRAGEKIFHN